MSAIRPVSREVVDQYTADAMIEAKLTRKRAEGDLQLLMNRIALLETEEQKATNKIIETKSRATEIRQIKKRNEDTVQEQFSITLGREIAVKMANERALSEREITRRKLSVSRKIVEDMNRLKASEKKQESRKFDEFAQNVRMQAEIERRKKAEVIKRKEEMFRQQREREREEKELAARLEYAQKIEMERVKREEADRLIRELERKEQDLIQRLKKAQEKQQEVNTVHFSPLMLYIAVSYLSYVHRFCIFVPHPIHAGIYGTPTNL